MHMYTYAEQQFLKWIVMFWYKLAPPSEQYLILFFLSIFWYCRAVFHMSRAKVIFLKGIYIYILMKCGLSALLNVNLSFTAKQVTT